MQKLFTTTGSENAILCQVTDTHLDTFINEARAATDLTQAKGFYLQAQQILEQDVPCIPTGTQADIMVSGLNVHGYYARPDSSNRSLISATVG